MKKEYISPEVLIESFETQREMLFNISNNTTVGAGSSLAPDYYEEEDDEDWGDEAATGGY